MTNKIIISLLLVLFTSSALSESNSRCVVYRNHTQSPLTLNIKGNSDVSASFTVGFDPVTYVTATATSTLQPNGRSACYCMQTDTHGTISASIKSTESMLLKFETGMTQHWSTTPGNDGGIVDGYYVLSRDSSVCGGDGSFQFNICDNTNDDTRKPCTDQF